MKKLLVLASALAVTGLTGVAKAADMKYVDVPSGHWAYDAIKFADEVGCWEGYPDGTFRGNRNITRYEMAMLIERIIKKCVKIPEAATPETPETPEAKPEKDEKALAEAKKLKAMLDKLQAEFKDELAALKTQVKKVSGRVDDLEKDQKRQDKELSKLKDMIGNVKLSGTVRSRVDTYGSDLNARNSAAVLAGDPVVGGLTGAATVETEYGYELFYDLLFSAKAGENVDVLVEMNNWASDLRWGAAPANNNGSRTPQIDQAYAAIDLTGKTQSLDSLKVTLGTQYYAFGPHRLLVDNGWESHPTLRVDLSKDIVDFTALGSVVNQIGFGGVGLANPVNAGAGQDALAALRLGLNLKPAKLGVNYLASGAGEEKGWGVDFESRLLRNTNWFNGVTAEFYQLTDDQAGLDPGCAGAGCTFAAGATNDEMDSSWMVAFDVYKSKKTLVNAYYADIGLTSGWTGSISNPFAEFNGGAGVQAGGNGMWSYQLNPFLFDSYHQIAPDFEGFGAKVVHSFSKDVTVSAVARKGDLNSAPTLEHPAYGAVRVSKGINDDTTFSIDYAQYGGEDIYINRLRGELVVNF